MTRETSHQLRISTEPRLDNSTAENELNLLHTVLDTYRLLIIPKTTIERALHFGSNRHRQFAVSRAVTFDEENGLPRTECEFPVTNRE